MSASSMANKALRQYRLNLTVGVRLCSDSLQYDVVQSQLEAAQNEAQVLEIKRQGQLKALEAQKARQQVCHTRLPWLPGPISAADHA